MMSTKRALVVVLGLFLCITACHSPKHTGGGAITAIKMRPDVKPVGIYVSPGEEFVVVQTAAPAHLNTVFRADFQRETFRALAFQDFAFGDTHKTAACLAPLRAHVLSMPDLLEASTSDLPKVFNSDRVNRIPGQGSWVVTSSDRGVSNVWTLAGDPPNFVKSGRTALPMELRGRAVDDETLLLLITDDTNRLEFFDLDSMTSEGVITLPCREVHNALVARNGFAWVGTREGTVIPIDIEKRAAGDVIRMGTGKGHVFLALSGNGGLLGVAVQDLTAGKPPYPTYLKVFMLSGNTPVELATTFFEHRSLIKDIAVLGTTEFFAVATRSHLLKWDWGKNQQ